ncbi:RING finger protein [Plakobranchus ocellatus]|uniref:RING finger protein n=1 Tax=Plakobranchus ocellatus TaxID=259542 RepID=A0AAV4C619_9GAST|nr:RING finger protein [Plakobranchus ocellatus]
MAQSQPLPSDRPAQTQSLSANPQVTEVKPTTSDTSGQREAMAQSQPLPSDRPTQTQSNSVSSQELSVQSTPSNSADEREAMASQQPLRLHQPCSVQTQSHPDNRQEHESSLHGNQSEQPNTNSQDHEDRFRVAHPDNGLSEDKIQEIPTRQFSRGAERSGSDQTSCVFCICDFKDKQLLRILPCFHEFHAECVDEWLKTHHTCPVCRHDVTENRSKS